MLNNVENNNNRLRNIEVEQQKVSICEEYIASYDHCWWNKLTIVIYEIRGGGVWKGVFAFQPHPSNILINLFLIS